MSSPKISVVMSCYNGSRWLQQAIDSVLAQTFEDFEFILVDDGSMDETWNIIQSNRDRDKRIVGISKKNTGLADSLNVGIATARGAWVARLDADDLCEPSRLEEQVGFVRTHPEVVLLGSAFIEIDEQGQVKKKHVPPSDHRKLVRHLEQSRLFFPHSSAFYRLDKVRQLGCYNVRFRISQDRRLWLEFAWLGEIACQPKALVRIRTHPEQMSTEENGRKIVCDGVAATVCYFLRASGREDPARSAKAEEWMAFMRWVEKRLEELGGVERYKAWFALRTEFFDSQSSIAGTLRLGIHLLQSGHAKALVWQKCFGSSLPKRLADEWMKKS